MDTSPLPPLVPADAPGPETETWRQGMGNPSAVGEPQAPAQPCVQPREESIPGEGPRGGEGSPSGPSWMPEARSPGADSATPNHAPSVKPRLSLASRLHGTLGITSAPEGAGRVSQALAGFEQLTHSEDQSTENPVAAAVPHFLTWPLSRPAPNPCSPPAAHRRETRTYHLLCAQPVLPSSAQPRHLPFL